MRTNESAGALRFMHPCRPRIPAEPSVGNCQGWKPRAGIWLHRTATKSWSRSRCSVSMRVPGVAAGLRLAAVGDLVAGVPIALAWNAVDAVRSDPLLQLFHVQ